MYIHGQNGWIKDYPDAHFVRNVQRLCEPVKNNLQVSTSPPKWLKNRYKLVQYEQMVVHPMRAAKSIYEFLGLKLVSEVVEWIESRQKSPRLKI